MKKLKVKKRILKKILKGISFKPAPLSTNKGRMIDSPESRHISKKDKRNKGRVVVASDDPDYPIQFEYWDEWGSYADGQRDKSAIIKNIYPQMYWCDEDVYWNKRKEIQKIRKHEQIRRLRKLRGI